MPSPNSKEKYWYRYRGHQYPTIAYVEILQDAVIKEAGGLPGIKDQGLLDSAMHAPVRAVGGEDLYPTFFAKVAALGYFIARNHPFADGNKRTSFAVMADVLEKNGYYLQWEVSTATLIMPMLAAGHLEISGLRFALLHGCDLDTADDSL